ncbi:speckle-type POZ protein B-like [Cotesia glomerata]|uniref:speckle-type POZ protein B-like n=1 Tax=Cotesia glomerata TaxID=32391 RepID=UPI001D0142FB|nr:speckle-type POZ protein B-like [Cotesia glomerata]
MKRGYTMINQSSVTYEWKINNIDAYLNVTNQGTDNTCLSSPKFSTGIKEKYTWQLELVFENNSRSSNKDIMRLELFCSPKTSNNASCGFSNTVSSNSTIKMIKYSVYILDNKKEKKMMTGNHLFFTKSSWTILPLSKKVLLEKVDEYLPDNILTVGLDLTIYEEPSNYSSDTSLRIPSKRPMTEDYKKLFKSKIASDVIINVCGKEFKTHKVCLIARSPVLEAMFLHEMTEKKTNKIDIVDLSPTIFEKILEFVYTDEVTNLDAHAQDLLEAADKYQIDLLKDICQESICKTLTQENALKFLVLADFYNADHLLKFTINFILINMNNVMKSQEFLDFKKENPVLASDLLSSFVSSPGQDDQPKI